MTDACYKRMTGGDLLIYQGGLFCPFPLMSYITLPFLPLPIFDFGAVPCMFFVPFISDLREPYYSYFGSEALKR